LKWEAVSERFSFSLGKPQEKGGTENSKLFYQIAEAILKKIRFSFKLIGETALK
jgi:hypothetical protein